MDSSFGPIQGASYSRPSSCGYYNCLRFSSHRACTLLTLASRACFFHSYSLFRDLLLCFISEYFVGPPDFGCSASFVRITCFLSSIGICCLMPAPDAGSERSLPLDDVEFPMRLCQSIQDIFNVCTPCCMANRLMLSQTR